MLSSLEKMRCEACCYYWSTLAIREGNPENDENFFSRGGENQISGNITRSSQSECSWQPQQPPELSQLAVISTIRSKMDRQALHRALDACK